MEIGQKLSEMLISSWILYIIAVVHAVMPQAFNSLIA